MHSMYDVPPSGYGLTTCCSLNDASLRSLYHTVFFTLPVSIMVIRATIQPRDFQRQIKRRKPLFFCRVLFFQGKPGIAIESSSFSVPDIISFIIFREIRELIGYEGRCHLSGSCRRRNLLFLSMACVLCEKARGAWAVVTSTANKGVADRATGAARDIRRRWFHYCWKWPPEGMRTTRHPAVTESLLRITGERQIYIFFLHGLLFLSFLLFSWNFVLHHILYFCWT